MGKAPHSVAASEALTTPLLHEPLLDVLIAFFCSNREGWCRLRVVAPPPERPLSPWTVWLSQEDDNDGWRFPDGILAAASAAWQSLARLRHGDWPVPADPRFDALPFHPEEMEWIEEIEGLPARTVRPERTT